MAQAAMQAEGPWWTGLTSNHWRILLAAFLGWIFDGYETYALVAVLGVAVPALLPQTHGPIPFYAGLTLGLTLLGWGVGGMIGGVIADYIGRKRTMLISIVGYAVFTGLTALSSSIEMFIAFRFLTGLFMGSEWGTGNTLLAETWPNRARPKGAGLLQSGFGFGAFLVAGVWYFIRPLGPEAWRWVFVVGIVPALFVFFIRRTIGESERWLDTIRDKRWLVTEMEEGRAATGQRPFTLTQIFKDAEGRRRLLLGFGLSLATTLGWWSVATWIPGFVGGLAKATGENAAYWGSLAGVLYNVGGIIGYVLAGFIADALGRRKYLLFLNIGSLVMTPVVYLWTHSLGAMMVMVTINGFFTSGAFGWFAIYLPELFATNVRATSSAFLFNASRLIACFGPIFAGGLIAAMGGVSMVAVYMGLIYVLGIVIAPFMPETKGKPIPA
jgi:MFS family permease